MWGGWGWERAAGRSEGEERVEEGALGRRGDWEVSPGLVSGERRTNTSFVVRKALGTKGEFEFHSRSVQGILKRQFSAGQLN